MSEPCHALTLTPSAVIRTHIKKQGREVIGPQRDGTEMVPSCLRQRQRVCVWGGDYAKRFTLALTLTSTLGTHIYTCIHTNARTHTRTHVYTYTRMHTHAYTRMHSYIRMHAYTMCERQVHPHELFRDWFTSLTFRFFLYDRHRCGSMMNRPPGTSMSNTCTPAVRLIGC